MDEEAEVSTEATKAFFDAWTASVDMKAMMLDHYRRELGVEDLSSVPMVSEEKLWANRSGGPMCAVDKKGNLLYEAPLFMYRFSSKS